MQPVVKSGSADANPPVEDAINKPTTGGNVDGSSYILSKEDGSATALPPMDIMDYYPNTSKSELPGQIVNSSMFQNVVIVLIVVNSIMIGVSTDDFVTENEKLSKIFSVIDTIFLSIFTIELALQFAHHGYKLFQSGWLTFDFTVIFFSWIFLGTPIQVIRAFRCFRLASRIKIFQVVIDALLMVWPRLFAIVVVLLLMFYVFAVMFTDMFKDMYRNGQTSDDYFGSMGKTLFTLFQVMTGAGWPDIAREVMKVYSWAWFPFEVFIFISSFVVIQLVIAVLCDSLQHIREHDAIEQKGELLNVQAIEDGEAAKEEIKRLEAKIDSLTKQMEMLLQIMNK